MSSIMGSPIGPATAGKRGTQSAAHFTKLEDLPANAALEARLLAIESAGGGAVDAVTEANGLTLTTGTLAMAAAANGVAGALTTGAQEVSGAKTFLASLTAAVEAVTALVRAVGVSLVLRSSLGAGASDKCVVVGSSEEDGAVNAAARLMEWQTGIGGVPITKSYMLKSGELNLGSYLSMPNAAAGSIFWSSVTMFGNNVDGSLSFRYGAGSVVLNLMTTSGRIDQSGTDSSASPGAATINKPTGKSAIASGATSVRITNSQVAAADQVHATMQGDCGQRHWCVAGAGYFDLVLPAAASANTAFCWTVSKRL